MAQSRRRIAPHIAIAACTVLVLGIFGFSLRQGGAAVPIQNDQLSNPAARQRAQQRSASAVAPTRLSSASVPAEACGNRTIVYPEWPQGFQPNVSAVFIIGEQKSGTTWLWEMLNAHPCLMTAVEPHARIGAITTKETYYLTSTHIGSDAREFLVPWLGLNSAAAASSEAWQSIGEGWLERAHAAADRAVARTAREFHAARTYVKPMKMLAMRPCERYFLLEATPHNLHTPVAAERARRLFPDARAIAVLKEPVWRMRSAYNQFAANFARDCRAAAPSAWCPVHRYYQMQLPTFAQAMRNELEYLKHTGCTFQSDDPAAQQRTWLDCFGCGVLEPWRHLTEGVYVTTRPYVPSAALGMYAQMLSEWLRWFPAPQLRAMNYQQLADEPFDVVNRMLRFIGVEEYTAEHWEVLRPARLGFRGHAAADDDEDMAVAEAAMAAFFQPHNARLDALAAAQGWPWVPFSRP